MSFFREIFLSPLIVTDLLGKVDIIGHITDGPGGASVIPRIIRHGASLCIAALFPDHFDKLRLGTLSIALVSTSSSCKGLLL